MKSYEGKELWNGRIKYRKESCGKTKMKEKHVEDPEQEQRKGWRSKKKSEEKKSAKKI